MPLQIPGWANKHKQHRQDTWWLGGVLLHCYRCHRHRTRRCSSSLSSSELLLMDFKECCYNITMCSMSLLPLLLWVWPDRAFDLFQLLASAVAEQRKSYVLSIFDQKSSYQPIVMNFEFLRILSQNVGQTLAWFCLAKEEKNMYQAWQIPVTTLINP